MAFRQKPGGVCWIAAGADWERNPWGAPMSPGETLFAQLMDFLPMSAFTHIVDRYDGEKRLRIVGWLTEIYAKRVTPH